MIIKNYNPHLFKQEWEIEVQRMMRNGVTKIPDHPGPGWLAGIAARHNLCAATWREGNDWAVCAAPLSKYGSENPYFCRGCYRKIQEMQEVVKKEPAGVPF